MRGSLRQRGKDSWQGRIFVGNDPATGKARYIERTFKGGKRECERQMAALITEYLAGRVVAPQKGTVREFMAAWLAGVRLTVALRTAETYSYVIDARIDPTLGDIPLQKLTAADIRRAYAVLRESGRKDGKGGLSETTVNQAHRVLKEALKSAVVDGLLGTNPCDRVKAPKITTQESEVLDEAQTARLLAAALEQQPSLYIGIVLLASTGMRRGELLGLTWENCDLSAGTVTITRALLDTRNGEALFGKPKTKRSHRTLRLPAAAVEALREWRAKQFEYRQRVGECYHDNNLIISREDGKPLDPAGFSGRFNEFIRTLDLPPIRLHDLRHGHASALIDQGAPITEVSARLGHSLTSTTLNLYAHRLKGGEERMLAVFEKRMKEASGEV